jgi:hypothetical protein
MQYFNLFVILILLKCVIGLYFPRILRIDSRFAAISRKISLSLAKSTAFSPTVAKPTENNEMDLAGHALWVTYTGFEVENMTFAMEFQENNKVKFCKGLTGADLGFWRVLKTDDGSDNLIVEATHPLKLEHMFFMNVNANQLLWRGVYDKAAGKVINGEVTANMKRFFLFPYTKSCATFTADVYLPGQALPEFRFPDISKLPANSPEGFNSPLDMKRFPELFDPEYVEWWFACEVTHFKLCCLIQ